MSLQCRRMPSFLAIADFFAPAIARTRLNIHLRSEDFVRIVLRGAYGLARNDLLSPSKSSFPAQYAGDGFAAEHGSWNRANRGGYEVIRIPMKKGNATGEYEDFLTGFVTADGQVWGRPVGVTVGHDGVLYVTDDGSRSVWRVTYTGK